MSNTAVGPVYDTIIAEVVNAVRVDFEENGVDDTALEDLKKIWQHKLSQMKVAQFPWDPKPEAQAPPAPANNGPPAPAPTSAAAAATSYTQSTLSPQQSSAQSLSLPGPLLPTPQNPNAMAMKPDPGFVQAEPAIKQEPGMQGNVHPGYNPTNGARPTAAQRAALALESQFGHRAAASINAIHSGMVPQQLNAAGQPQPQQGQRPGQMPQHMNPQQQQQQHMNPQQHQQHMNPQQHQQHMNAQQQQQHMNPQQQQQQYRQGVAAAIQQRMQQVPRPGAPNGLPAAQHDGPSDAAESAADSGHPATMDRAQIDQYLHSQIAERAKQMEGGGLMLPLKKATKSRGLAKKRGDADGPAQLDGPDDDVKSEEDDEDAINSDLDDPDELGADDDDDEDEMGHMMLCMYDKVQRVKNKWKCVLKDGVLTVNGKEYVFHKATGEYEW